MNEAQEFRQEDFLGEIFEDEAKALLRDIMSSTSLVSLMSAFEEDQVKKAIEYIVGIFNECYKFGHLKVATSSSEQTLCGYAMIFVHPHHQSAYLHKIQIVEQFRGGGLGTEMLQSISQSFGDLGLICNYDKIKFYERNGFKCVGDFKVPDGEDFKMSKHMYSGLYLMSNSKKVDSCHVFFLNDYDLKAIGNIL